MVMTKVPVNGVEICHEVFGDADRPTLVLINGLASQMLGYPVELCEEFVGHGYQVVRLDNRDVGESTWPDVPFRFGAGFKAFRAGEPVAAPYDLSDMATDVVGLLDALGIDCAHIAGMSMGGMIAQTIAIEHPTRTLSLTSIMSSTGEREYGRPTPEANDALMQAPATDRATAVANGIAAAMVIGSPDHVDPERVGRIAGEAYDRGYNPAGAARQLLAIWASGSRADRLRQLEVPTLVIHGDADPLINPDAGHRTAEIVPGAELVMVEGMGHDLPPPLWPVVVPAITDHLRRAEHPQRMNDPSGASDNAD